jgi:hypothetical protein
MDRNRILAFFSVLAFSVLAFSVLAFSVLKRFLRSMADKPCTRLDCPIKNLFVPRLGLSLEWNLRVIDSDDKRFKAGDTITHIDDCSVSTTVEYAECVSALGNKETVIVFTVKRQLDQVDIHVSPPDWKELSSHLSRLCTEERKAGIDWDRVADTAKIVVKAGVWVAGVVAVLLDAPKGSKVLNGGRCFRCNGYGHWVAQCPN